MVRRLIEMYENGSITGYQIMIDCLRMLDRENPDPVLSELPEEILDEILGYARRYDPHRPRPATFILPTEDRVRAAERWACAHHAMRPRPVNR